MIKYIVNDHKTGFSVSRKIQNCINSFYTNEISFRTMYKFWNINDQNDKYVCIT